MNIMLLFDSSADYDWSLFVLKLSYRMKTIGVKIMAKITLSDIKRTYQEIQSSVINTPFNFSDQLSQLCGCDVYLKYENLQHTASFKARGALADMQRLSAVQKTRGIIAMSAGNHAQAVAYHARRLNIPTTIVMPEFTPNVKIEATRAYGANIILHGQLLDDSAIFAKNMAKEKGLYVIHPYDNLNIIMGQGSIALELLAVQPDIDAIIVPIGGGGLIAGIAIAAKSIKPSIKVYGAQTTTFPTMYAALRDEKITCGAMTIAEGIAIKKPGELTTPFVEQYVDDIFLVEETAIEKAILSLLKFEKTSVEGAGAASAAALIKNKAHFSQKKVALILSGGNIDLFNLSTIIQRSLVRSYRLVRLNIRCHDFPGSLAQITQVIAQSKANIIEISHQRAFSNIPLQDVEINLTLQIRGKAHLEEIIQYLHAVDLNDVEIIDKLEAF